MHISVSAPRLSHVIQWASHAAPHHPTRPHHTPTPSAAMDPPEPGASAPRGFAGTGNSRILYDAVLAVEAGVYGYGLGELPDGSGEAELSGDSAEARADPDHAEAESDALFTLGRVQYAFPAPLSVLQVANNVMVMCLSSGSRARLNRIDLDNPGNVEDVPLPPVRGGGFRLFLDPSGRHVLLSHPASAQMYWWMSGWKRVRALPRNHALGLQVESVSWHRPLANSTGPILVGTRSGEIWETSLSVTQKEDFDFLDRLTGRSPTGDEAEAYWTRMFYLPLPERVTGLYIAPLKRDRAYVIAATASRIYEFDGPVGRKKGIRQGAGFDPHTLAAQVNDGGLLPPQDAGDFEQLFSQYRDTTGEGDAAKCLRSEVPALARPEHSVLRVWTPQAVPPPQEARRSSLTLVPEPQPERPMGKSTQIAWLVAPGVYYANLGEKQVLDQASLLPFPSAKEPLSMALTQFHTVLLYPAPDARVECIRNVDDARVFSASLSSLLMDGEQVRGVSADPIKHTVWIYTSASIFELVIQHEGRHVWRALLKRNRFAQALDLAPTPAAREAVVASQGDRLILRALGLSRENIRTVLSVEDKRHLVIQAAGLYAQTTIRPFEKMVIALSEADSALGEPEGGGGLRTYLATKLERTPKKNRIARMMVGTWLLEALLARWDELEDTSAAQAAGEEVDWFAQRAKEVAEQVDDLLRGQKDVLPPSSVYRLARLHAREEVLISFATVTGDHKTRLYWYLDHGEYILALRTLAGQDDMELYYASATPLLQRQSKETVDAWMREPRLEVRRLLPSLLLHPHEHVVRYLLFLVEAGSRDVAVHNTLVALLAKSKGDNLLQFLDTHAAFYDLAYALRVSLAHGQRAAAVRVYTLMGREQDAVSLALEGNDVEAACRAAAGGDKQLWLRIARHVVEGAQDVRMAMDLVRRSGVLSIEDVLPFFPDFVVMDAFKGQVTDALESYAAQIANLSRALDEAALSAQRAQGQTLALQSTRFVTLHPEQVCIACSLPLLPPSTPFYTFICGHAFHLACLVEAVAKRAPRRTLRTWLAKHNQLAQLAGTTTLKGIDAPPSQRTVAVLAQALADPPGKDVPPEDEARMAALRDELGAIVAAACPTCAAAVVNVDAPLDGEGEAWPGDFD